MEKTREKNLKKFGKDKPALTHEQAVEVGRRGGIASGEVRKIRKNLPKVMRKLLSMRTSKKMQEALSDFDYDENRRLLDLMILKQVEKAIYGGDIEAFSALLEKAYPTISDESNKPRELKLSFSD